MGPGTVLQPSDNRDGILIAECLSDITLVSSVAYWTFNGTVAAALCSCVHLLIGEYEVWFTKLSFCCSYMAEVSAGINTLSWMMITVALFYMQLQAFCTLLLWLCCVGYVSCSASVCLFICWWKCAFLTATAQVHYTLTAIPTLGIRVVAKKGKRFWCMSVILYIVSLEVCDAGICGACWCSWTEGKFDS